MDVKDLLTRLPTMTNQNDLAVRTLAAWREVR